MICRLLDSRRHQLSTIARRGQRGGAGPVALLLKSVGIRFAVFDVGQGARNFFPSHAVAFKGDTVGVVDDPVEDSIGDGWRIIAAQVLEKPHLLSGDVLASQGIGVLSKERTDP